MTSCMPYISMGGWHFPLIYSAVRSSPFIPFFSKQAPVEQTVYGKFFLTPTATITELLSYTVSKYIHVNISHFADMHCNALRCPYVQRETKD